MTADESQQRRDAAQRRRLDEVFGDVLPDSADADPDAATDGAAAVARRDSDLLRDVPPHHTG